MYGVGIETERAYFYKTSNKNTSTEGDGESDADLPFVMDSTLHDPPNNVQFRTKFSDGDVSTACSDKELGIGCMVLSVAATNFGNEYNPMGMMIMTAVSKI